MPAPVPLRKYKSFKALSLFAFSGHVTTSRPGCSSISLPGPVSPAGHRRRISAPAAEPSACFCLDYPADITVKKNILNR